MGLAVIGRVVDTEVAHDWPGHEMLAARGWTLARNLDFVRAIVRERRPVYLASPVRRANLVDARGGLTLFGRELAILEQAGFTRAGALLLPPDPFAVALAQDPIALFERLRARAARGDHRVPELAPTLALLAALRPQHDEEARALVAAGVPYAAALRFAHRFVTAVDGEARATRPDLVRVYQPKVGAELVPLIDLYPDVVAFPTLAPLDAGAFSWPRAWCRCIRSAWCWRRCSATGCHVAARIFPARRRPRALHGARRSAVARRRSARRVPVARRRRADDADRRRSRSASHDPRRGARAGGGGAAR